MCSKGTRLSRDSSPSAITATQPVIGLALSGGGSRAIAFHLGCLRALHRLSILDQVSVVSCVSGGAVIGAAYAYSTGPFSQFEAKITSLLQSGLQAEILRRHLLSWRFPASLGTLFCSGVPATIAELLGHPAPFRRWISRTNTLESVLRSRLFLDLELTSSRRNGLDIVINACDLNTGTAFRFGSRESGSWRVGKLIEPTDVATAVCASAAYPLFFPPLDLVRDLRTPNGKVEKRRLLLTDGGVYDNLGVTCLEPGRISSISTNVYRPDYIVCCHAGSGLPEGTRNPFGGFIRHAIDVTFRRVQDATMARLHAYKDTGALRGFVLAYLGQQDDRLPERPAELIPRELVMDYPTNFAAMTGEDIFRIATRGEQLTSLLLRLYCPELLESLTKPA